MFAGQKSGPSCHKCGSAPNTDKPCVALSVCKGCGKYTCNQHLVGWTASTCPACNGDTQVIARQTAKIQGKGIQSKDFGGPKKAGAKSSGISTGSGGFNNQSGFSSGSQSSTGKSAGGAGDQGAAPKGFSGGASSGSFNLGGGGVSSIKEAQPEEKEIKKASEAELYGSATIEGQVKNEDGEVIGTEETNDAAHGMLGTVLSTKNTKDTENSQESSNLRTDSGSVLGTTGVDKDINSTSSKNEHVNESQGFALEDIGINLDFTSYAEDEVVLAKAEKNYSEISASAQMAHEDSLGKSVHTETEDSVSTIPDELESQELTVESSDESFSTPKLLSASEMEQMPEEEQIIEPEPKLKAEETVKTSLKKTRDDYLADFIEHIDKIEKKEAEHKRKDIYFSEGSFIGQRDMDIKSYLNDINKTGYHFSIAYLSSSIANNKALVMNSLGEDNANHFISLGIPAKQAGNIEERMEEELIALEELIKTSPKAIAIGPIGLDLKFAAYTKDLQINLFKKQVALAEKYKLPILIQHIKACKEVLEIIKDVSSKILFVDIVNSEELADFIINNDKAYVLFRSEYTHRDFKEQLDLLEKMPMNSIIVGSGDTVLAPASKLGQLNNTKFVPEIFKFAEVYYRKEPHEFTFNNLLNTAEFFSDYQRPKPKDPYDW